MVDEVAKLPHPYFPLKKYNHQVGGLLHITPTFNVHQAVHVPQYACEFKGVQLCYTAYNVEDYYDIMIGSRLVVQGAHVKEMSEDRYFEVFEVVEAGTPIVIQHHNISGLEKYLMYDFRCLVDTQNIIYPGIMSWNFTWDDDTIVLDRGDTLTLMVSMPNYVNLASEIDTITVTVNNKLTQMPIASLTGNASGVSSTYSEYYGGHNLLARNGEIGIISARVFEKSIEIIFKNLSTTQDNHPIELSLVGIVTNKSV